ncbi:MULTISPECIES: FadR/GntR family transcriptional regulator [Alphaproteobacteria]|uniref:GntR family transcriptional regulator n=2 Tax=Alphaproteobacteria TaxID=28211 RepID=A0A512HN96_9HYPH|nr:MULTISPECIES: FadR/GntR family transcriptional regulator [Alphaproteobacteria]GEO86928.1 GntR family transcriptional regulator [Ciceribacter naphthalenivorans]GLR22242.1 GntR family transcriptional regulator [Ciceribacter naphthalenivorans]GLT05098.1 GntR family transcriptional regulator [Sphingomonas psychrolutea]
MKPVQKTSLADTATEAIREEIISGRFPVGSRLPNEATLCTTLGVSRGTVREAVRVLASQGLLEVLQGSGTYVRSASDGSRTLDAARHASLRDRFEARCALDVEAARLAARRATPATIARLRALLAQRGNSDVGDRESFITRDLAFHKAVIAASGNRAMIELFNFFSASITETIQATTGGELPEPDIAAHAAIIDAIETGDPDKADAAVRRFMAPVFAFLDGKTDT